MWIIRPFNYYSFWSHNTHNLKNLRWVISFLTLYLVERRFACFQPCSDMPAVKSFCIFFRYISNRNKMAWPKQLREGFTWIFISREMWAHHHQGREGWCLKELRKSSHIETPAWKKEQTWNGVSLWNLKATFLQNHPFLSKSYGFPLI